MNDNLLLTLDDAVKVAMNYIYEHSDNYGIVKDDEDLMRSEMEQKCWINRHCDDARRKLVELIMDVRPVEICSQIQKDTLTSWCESWQNAAQLALMKV